MSIKEQYRNAQFDENERISVYKIAKERRVVVITLSVIIVLFFLVSPIYSRRGEPLISQMSYWEALLWMFPFMFIVAISSWHWYRKIFNDSRNGLKVILQTKVTAQNGSRKNMKIKVSNPEIGSWLFFRYTAPYIHKGDCVQIEILPESKVILKCIKIIEE